MRILIVQESDWIERNPHQQHHLMDRLSVKGHSIRVIDHGIDWRRKDEKRFDFLVDRKVYHHVHKVNPKARIQVIRPSLIQIPVLDYVSIPYFHGKEIERQIKEFNPDIIIAFGLLNANLAAKSANKHGIPFVYYLIDVLYALIPEKIFQGLGKNINKRTIARSDLVLTINKRLAELAIELGSNPEKTQIIDAGIDLKQFNPDLDGSRIRDEYGINKDDTVLFFMGWIYHFAGMKELAIELGQNKEKYPQIKIVVVGDGDAYDDMVRIRDKYGLQDQLILTGKQPYNLIPEFTAAADICLLPAHQDEEIMQDIVPIKIYEYMAMEKPVIVTRLPGISMEFGEGHGLQYINGSEEVLPLAQKMRDENIIKDEGKKARQFVKNNDWELITERFEETINKLIKDFSG
ncbi:MAG: glycosyltransferase family 4 protein [Methanobacteriaceae archaeon]|nr:glycosyltransferase family 4 protein [Methanobacteriaceae archaeon]